MEVIVLLAGLGIGVFILPVVIYVAAGSRKNWGMIRDGRVTRALGMYRGTPQPVWVEGSAPLVLRIAAFTSFLLGQMIIPGAFAAIIGFIALVASLGDGKFSLALIVISLSAPTGLIVASRLLTAGVALLGRNTDAVRKARTAAAWEMGHNAVLAAGLIVAAMVGNHDEQVSCMLVGVLTGVAMVHGVLLRMAASALEAYDVAESEPARGGEPVAPTFA